MNLSKYSATLGIAVTLALTVVSCSDDETKSKEQQAYDAASVVNGARLYDKFWADETDYISPNSGSVNQADIEEYGEFYRCKTCHGWDQKGTSGSYINRGPTTTRPNVSPATLVAVKNDPIRELFDEIKQVGGALVSPSRTADGANTSLGGDNMPDYSLILNDNQIWDLVKFLREGAFDTEQLYTISATGTYPSGSRTFSDIGKDGNAALGETFFASNCASCHGQNGRDDGAGNILSINSDIGLSMGQFARTKPYELQHKARFGNLGSSPEMLGVNDATLNDIKNLLKALSNSTKYPNL